MRSTIILLSMATGCHIVAGLDEPSRVETTATSSSNSTGGTGGTGGAGGVACSAGTAVYRDIVLADEPVAYWRLGDSGGEAKDETETHGGTYQHAGYLLNQPGALVCDLDAAVRFSGEGALILVGANVHDVAPLSLEAWIRPEGSDSVNRYVIAKALADAGGATGYALYVHDSFLTFVVAQNGVSIHASTMQFVFADWNHVVGTLEESTACLYVNGVLVEACTTRPVTLTTTNEPFKIGAYRTSGEEAFIGSVDEVAIYDAVLSDVEVRAHYAAGLQLER